MKPRQLALDLPIRVARDREDFLVTPSNAAAITLIDQWPNWPSYAACIVGPPGSGKTHLCHVFVTVSGAKLIAAEGLTVEEATFGPKEIALELGESVADERALFHLLNRVRQQNGHILLTSTKPLSQLQISLPDLSSRLGALPVVVVGQPDDELLSGVLMKQFSDRQLALEPAALNHLLQRMPRALDDVTKLVSEIDRRAMEERKSLSRGFVSKVLVETFPEMNGDGR